jgi:hypothetical protein
MESVQDSAARFEHVRADVASMLLPKLRDSPEAVASHVDSEEKKIDMELRVEDLASQIGSGQNLPQMSDNEKRKWAPVAFPVPSQKPLLQTRRGF